MQGYPSCLIGMMVEGVPSMHICLDFISELLEQTQISQQVGGAGGRGSGWGRWAGEWVGRWAGEWVG